MVLLSLSVGVTGIVTWRIPPVKFAKMKRHDSRINYSINSDAKGINILFLALRLLCLIGSLIIHGAQHTNQDNGFWYNCLVPWCPGHIFYIGFCATYTLVATLSVYWRCTALNSSAACKPGNVPSLCDAMSNHYVSVKCTTNNEEMWVPASSAWPSVLIIICFTALYFWYLSWKYETRNEFN